MSTTTTPARPRRWPWLVAAGLAAAAAGTWALWPDATTTADPAPTPSPTLSLYATDPGAGNQHAATPSPTASATATPDGDVEPVAEGGTPQLDDAAAQQAYEAGTAAVLAVVSQPLEETDTARTQRLAPLFVAGSPTPGAGAPLDLAGIGVTSLGRVEAAGVEWAEPFDPADGRVGFLVAVTAQTYGMREDDGDPIAWKDTSTQLWRVLLVDDGGTWTPQVAYLADQPDPTGDDA